MDCFKNMELEIDQISQLTKALELEVASYKTSVEEAL